MEVGIRNREVTVVRQDVGGGKCRKGGKKKSKRMNKEGKRRKRNRERGESTRKLVSCKWEVGDSELKKKHALKLLLENNSTYRNKNIDIPPTCRDVKQKVQ